MTEPEASPAPRASRIAVVARRALWGAVGLLLLLGLAGIGARMYFHDERLRVLVAETLSERLHTAVELEGLELGLLSGLRLDNLRVGPPPEFEHDVLRVKRIELSYAPSALLSGTLHIEQLEIVGIEAALERGEEGPTNIEVLMAAMDSPDPPSSPEDTSGPAQPSSNDDPLPTLPELPIAVVVDRVELGPVSILVDQPDLQLTLDELRADASLSAASDRYDLELWAGLGSRDDSGSVSTLVAHRGDALGLRSQQRLSVDFRFRGFDDITLAIDWRGETDADSPVDVPPIDSAVHLELQADLIEQRMTATTITGAIGEQTRLNAAFAATRLFTSPQLDVSTLVLKSELQELEPVIQALEPLLAVAGTLSASIEPTSIRVQDASDPSGIATSIKLEAQDVDAAYGANRISAMYANVGLDTKDALATLEATLGFKAAQTPQATLSELELNVAGSTPLKPWLNDSEPPSEEKVQLELGATLASVQTTAIRANDLRTDAKLSGSPEWIRGGSSSDSLGFEFNQGVGLLVAGGQSIRALRVSVDGALGDQAGNVVSARMRAGSGRIQSIIDAKRIVSIPSLSAAATLRRNRGRLSVPTMVVNVGGVAELTGELKARRITTRVPVLDSARVDLKPLQLEPILQFLSPALRPPMAISGEASFQADIAGEVPIDEIVATTSPPDLSGDWVEQIDEVGASLERYASLFELGFPLQGEASLKLNDVALRQGVTRVDGFDMKADLQLQESGPRLTLDTKVHKIAGAAEMEELKLETAFQFQKRAIRSKLDGGAAVLSGASGGQPLKDVSIRWDLAYDVGGALTLETFELLAPDRDGVLRGRFFVQDPIRAARSESFTRAGMPGVDLNADLDAAILIDDSTQISLPGLVVSGQVGFTATASVEDGLIAISGRSAADNLSISHEAAVVSNASGDIPFELVLATEAREGYVVLPPRVPFGDGRLRIEVDKPLQVATARPLYYPRTRRYQKIEGVRIAAIESRGFRLENLEIDGGLESGSLLARRARVSILGGDIEGSFAMRILGDRSIGGAIDLKVSNIDASYFPALDLDPGRDSEMDADGNLRFAFSPDRRDLTANMNVTRISRSALDRFLQLLDPEEANESIQRTRFWLNLAQINGVAMWLAYENLNMDLDANSIIKIPFTSIGVPSFERELLRREPMSERLDVLLDPIVKQLFRPLFGARNVR